MVFVDRRSAGQLLAAKLIERHYARPLVIGLPRGGVPIGEEIANALDATLDVLVVRKLGAPGNSEYGIGAVTEGDHYWINQEAVQALQIPERELKFVLLRELRELDRRVQAYRGGRPLTDPKGRDVIIADDGLATGVTALVAAKFIRERGASRITIAVPVGAADSVEALASQVDEIICLECPTDFWAVGLWYDDFRQIGDEEVRDILARFADRAVA